MVLVALLPFVAASRALAQNPPPNDVQQWTEVDVTYAASSRMAVTTFGQIRIGNDVSRFHQWWLGTEFEYSAWRWASLGLGYLYAHASQELTELEHENRFYATAIFKAPAFHGLVLSERLRPEMRWLADSSGAEFELRVQNRVLLERPFDVQARTYTPYVMWEKFYDASAHEWNETRYTAGLTAPVAARTKVELYFLYVTQNSRPFDGKVIGVTVTLIRGASKPVVTPPDQ